MKVISVLIVTLGTLILVGCSGSEKFDYSSPKTIMFALITVLQKGEGEIPPEVFAEPEKAMAIFNFTGNNEKKSELDMMMLVQGTFSDFTEESLTEEISGDKATVQYGTRVVHFKNIDGNWRIFFP